MRGTLTIAGRELRALFGSPLAWLILAGASFVLAWVFLAYVQAFLSVAPQIAPSAHSPGVTALVAGPALYWASLVLVVLTPLIAMRLLAGEKRDGTIRLLRSAPVSTTAIVVGKYLALVAFLWLVVAIAAAMPLTLELGTTLDLGRLGASALGLALVAAAFGAVALFVSALTSQPLIAAFGGFFALVLLLIVNLAARASDAGGRALDWLAFQPHLDPFFRGVVNTADLAYFLIMTALFLGLAVWKLDAERLGG